MNAVALESSAITKQLLTEVVIDLMKNRRDLWHEIMVEALEDVGLANAMLEGFDGDFVSQEEIFSILDDELK